MLTKSFQVSGKVQGVMFRQTFIRCCQRFKLPAAGATNSKIKTIVTSTVKGDEETLKQFLDHLRSFQGKSLNSWNARFEELKELETVVPIAKHQVTTENVDKKKWNPNVQFFL